MTQLSINCKLTKSQLFPNLLILVVIVIIFFQLYFLYTSEIYFTVVSVNNLNALERLTRYVGKNMEVQVSLFSHFTFKETKLSVLKIALWLWFVQERSQISIHTISCLITTWLQSLAWSPHGCLMCCYIAQVKINV